MSWRSQGRVRRASALPVWKRWLADGPRRAPLGEGWSPLVGPLAAGLMLAALILVALRVDILRMRYQQTAALEREQALREEQAELVLSVGRLRRPERLAGIASDLGFSQPTVVLWLPERPDVGAAPPGARDGIERAARSDRGAAAPDAGAQP